MKPAEPVSLPGALAIAGAVLGIPLLILAALLAAATTYL